MRKTERFPVKGANSLWHVYDTVPFWKVIKNFIFIQAARYSPFLVGKTFFTVPFYVWRSAKKPPLL